jgi:hypothetical protein
MGGVADGADVGKRRVPAEVARHLNSQPQKENLRRLHGSRRFLGLYSAMGASRRYASTKGKRQPFGAVPTDYPKFSVTPEWSAGRDRLRGGRATRGDVWGWALEDDAARPNPELD